MSNKKAFTLIELLIVVAIIAILAAIAVPNFLEAQTRSKVARTQADMRSLATAVEAYRIDYHRYPPYGRIQQSGDLQVPATDNANALNDQMAFITSAITTPTAYITTFFDDPFAGNRMVQGAATTETNRLIRKIEYLNMDQHMENFGAALPPFAPGLIPKWGHWRMVGGGPDGDRGLDIKMDIVYDPTNGTVSNGDIVRSQRKSDSTSP